MNILITIDNGYLDVRCVMLKSLLLCHPDTEFTVYVLNSSLDDEDFAAIRQSLPSKRMTIVDVKAGKDLLADEPVTERYPKEMYYRIFAAAFLPDNVDRVLYLDPDLVVIKPLYNLYSIDLDGFYFAAASHVGKFLTNLNALRLQAEENTPYINSGVMMINLSLLRKEQDFRQVFDYISKNHRALILPDQDVISAVYGNKILLINPYIYNMNDRLLILPGGIAAGITPSWVEENSAIIHYFGRNKPWKKSYKGVLGSYYRKVADTPLSE